MNNKLKVAACQLPEILNDVGQALKTIKAYALKAEQQGAQLVCFPECYLQGYIVDDVMTGQHALSLSSPEFDAILEYLSDLEPILVFGMIEKHEQNLYNTAVVVKKGNILGQYRKAKLLPGEAIFEAGNDFPIFEIDAFRFGVNICYDMNFPACAKSVSKQRAQLIVCPSNNMMSATKAERWKTAHHESRAQRALESGLWILSSDVTGKRDGRISYGPTSLINPHGDVVAQVPLLQEGLLVQDIIF